MGFTIVHTIWAIYEETTLQNTGEVTIVTPIRTIIGILFCLMLHNAIWKRRKPHWVITPGEMMVVFTMTTLSAVVISAKMLAYLFPTLLWPFHVPPSNAGYDPYASLLPPFFLPQNREIIHEFFNGTRQFWRFFHPDVWRWWVAPICFWFVFMFGLFWTPLCLGSLFRRQWADRERIQFPIIELPLMMARTNDARTLFSTGMLTIGFLIGFGLLTCNYLSGLFPNIPRIPLGMVDYGSAVFRTPPYTSLAPMLVVWWPYAIGLCYLIPLDVSFSCWFFYLLIRALTLVSAILAWRTADSVMDSSQFPYIERLAEGAWLGMFVLVIWNARGFLSELARALRTGPPLPGEDTEVMSYRTALWGALAGLVLLVVLSVLAGMRWQVALLTFGLYLLAILVMTRMYAQIAMPLFCMAFFSVTNWTTGLASVNALTRRELSLLTTYWWFDRTYDTLPMGHQMEAMVFADRLQESKRKLMQWGFGAMMFAALIGMITMLQIWYDRGASSAQVSSDPMWFAGTAWGRLMQWTGTDGSLNIPNLIRTGISGLIVLALAAARNAWFAFPLHPIGYLFATSFALEWGMWNIIMVTWLIKWLVVKYGGLKAYTRSLPLFLGLALGDAVAHFFWSAVLSLLGVRGAKPY